jgi:hypothetical protein
VGQLARQFDPADPTADDHEPRLADPHIADPETAAWPN